MKTEQQVAFEIADSYRGLSEIPGAAHNPQILEFFKSSGHGWVQDDETPWCAAFVGSCLAQAGLTGTNKLNARSYLNWGVAVDEADAQRGDIVVFWRKKPDGPFGHVAFFDSWGEDDTVKVLGGNQGNEVNVKPYPADKILGVRRARPKKGTMTKSNTVRASALNLAATGGMGATLAGIIPSIDPIAQYLVIALLGVSVITVVWILRERLKKWASGDD